MDTTSSQTNRNQLDTASYHALGRAAVLERDSYGALYLTGADRIDFLQRMTTNNIAALQPGQACVTVLTSPTARILFVFTVLARADDLILLTAGPQQATALAKHLRAQIFFMDKVTVHTGPVPLPNGEPDASKTQAGESLTGENGQIDGPVHRLRIVGQSAEQIIRSLGYAPLPEATFAEGNGVLILRQTRFDLPGYELLLTQHARAAILPQLENAGAPIIEDPIAYTVRRVENGLPAVGAEMTEDYNPLEVGLGWTCAENKGCYTGQEIIARQLTYDKITRSLVGLCSTQPLHAGATIRAEGRSIGTVTTAVYSPDHDAHLALAVVRRPHQETGTGVEIVPDPTHANGSDSGADAPNSAPVEATVFSLDGAGIAQLEAAN